LQWVCGLFGKLSQCVFLHLARDGEKIKVSYAEAQTQKRRSGARSIAVKIFSVWRLAFFTYQETEAVIWQESVSGGARSGGKLARHVLQSVGDI
jgi:hypothetical protein